MKITPFKAVDNNGVLATSWLYSGVDNSDGNLLVPDKDLIYVNPVTGSIIVS